MKLIIKVSKYSALVAISIILAAIPMTTSAQDIIDTSSPQDLLAAPTIVVPQASVEPDCHTWTGCSAIVVKRYHHYHYYKQKRYRVYHGPCY